MSAIEGKSPETVTYFAHALRLHRERPDEPLPHDGLPYPDEGPSSTPPPLRSAAQRAAERGVVVRLLDEHFAGPYVPPARLADVVADLTVSTVRDDDLCAAIHRADRRHAREAGRWLVRYGVRHSAVELGAMLLAETAAPADVPLIQTIGLLSDSFGRPAAHALERLGDVSALIWLADRVAGWGRVYVVEALCRLGGDETRRWLLRRAVDGCFLNGYFVHRLAEAAALHGVLPELAHDGELLDHTGRWLAVLVSFEGMGGWIRDYEHSAAVLAAHSTYVAAAVATPERFESCVSIADELADNGAARFGISQDAAGDILRRYLALLEADDWVRAARDLIAREEWAAGWLRSLRRVPLSRVLAESEAT